jgi:hypothetical protein
MGVTIVNADGFPEDVLSGKWAKGRNSSMTYSGCPTLASINMCYRVGFEDYSSGSWDEDQVVRGAKYCYSNWSIGRHVQFIPTYRPQVLRIVAEFIGGFIPPEMVDNEVIVRPSEFRFNSAALKQYPAVVEVEFDFPAVEGSKYTSYPRRAWLTWFSWLRAAWEFLPVEEERDTAVEYLLLGWMMQEYARDIHYPLYRPSATGQVDEGDVMALLQALQDGYYTDRSKLQDQGAKLLHERDSNRAEVIIEGADLEDVDLDGWADDGPDGIDLEDWVDDDEPDWIDPMRPDVPCQCRMCRRMRGEL